MAGNDNSGRGIAFRMGEKELNERIDKYKDMCDNGERVRPCVPDFYAFLGYSLDEMRELLSCLVDRRSAYYTRAVAVKRMIAWCQARVATDPGWAGQNQSKAIFLLKQDYGDGNYYRDQDVKAGGPAEVKISFGKGDPRASKAGK